MVKGQDACLSVGVVSNLSQLRSVLLMCHVAEEELSEEEKLKKETKERLRYEYYFTIKEEGM